MAYDSGIASLTKAGIAEDFIEKRGVPRDQIVPFLSSVSNKQGYGSMNPELAGLIAKKMAIENAAKQEQALRGAPPAAPPTVRQDIDQLAAIADQRRNVGIAAANIPSPVTPRGMASGGIVAFAQGGDTDLTKMTPEQLEMLAKGDDVTMARAAYKEYLRRSGYTAPQETLGKAWETYKSAVKQGLPKPMFTYDPRPFPSHMYDEEGNVRRSTGTLAGLGGVKEVPSSMESVRRIDPTAADKVAAAKSEFAKLLNREQAVAAATPPTTVRTPIDMMAAQSGSAFSATDRAEQNLREAMRGKPKQEAPRVPPRDVAAAPSAAEVKREEVPAVKSIEEYEKELLDMYSKRGIGKATEEYRKYLDEERAKGEKEGKVDTGLAIAKAGFRMMASTSPFAGVAIGEGGQELATQLAAVRKEQQANNRSMREAQFRLAQADELQAAGRIKDAMGMRKDAEARLERSQERQEMMNYRYAALASEERRTAATLSMQKAILQAREESDTRRANATLAVARQRAMADLSQDYNYQALQGALQKAQQDGDKEAIKKAEKAVRNYRDAYLAPIETEMSMMGGASAGETTYDALGD